MSAPEAGLDYCHMAEGTHEGIKMAEYPFSSKGFVEVKGEGKKEVTFKRVREAMWLQGNDPQFYLSHRSPGKFMFVVFSFDYKICKETAEKLRQHFMGEL